MRVPTDIGGNKKVKEDLYLYPCKVCRLGIYQGQPRVWTRGVYLGHCHLECADELGLVTQ